MYQKQVVKSQYITSYKSTINLDKQVVSRSGKKNSIFSFKSGNDKSGIKIG